MDLILTNANIRTLDARDRVAQALGVKNGRVAAVGSNHDVLSQRNVHSEVLDLGGKTVLPGLIDAHNHMLVYGAQRESLDCGSDKTSGIADIQKLIKKKAMASPPGNWIVGHGYNDSRLKEKRHPYLKELDAAAPHHPVVIFRSCLHMLVANTCAIQCSGVTEKTNDPLGGRIHRDPDSTSLTGLFSDTAQALIKKAMPSFSVSEMADALASAAEQYLKEGITTAHEAGVGFFGALDDELRAYQVALQRNRLKVRLSLYFMPQALTHLSELGILRGFGNEMLRVAGVKIFLDGAYSIHTAALKTPYINDPTNRGTLCRDEREFQDLIRQIHQTGLQASVHAIGDRAIETALRAFSRVLKHSSRRDHRHRIEHFTLAGTDHIKQARKLGLIVVANPSELNFYGDSLIENLGIERARNAFPLGSLLAADLPVAMGSDRPCANGNPLVGIQSAVVRRTHSGRLLGPDQSIRVVDAFRMYTQKAAYAAFEENLKGTLEIGKYADLAVFHTDPFKIPVAELVHLPIAYTIVGGQVVYADAPY